MKVIQTIKKQYDKGILTISLYKSIHINISLIILIIIFSSIINTCLHYNIYYHSLSYYY